MPTFTIVRIICFILVKGLLMQHPRRADLKFWILGIALIVCISILHARSLQVFAERNVPEEDITHDPMVRQAALRQSVDNFSDDARAMSPRSWGEFYDEDAPPLPPVAFDEQPVRDRSDTSVPPARVLQQVESSSLREPAEYYRTEPLDPSETNPTDNASKLPNNLENLLIQAQQEKQEAEQELEKVREELEKVKNQKPSSVVESKSDDLPKPTTDNRSPIDNRSPTDRNKPMQSRGQIYNNVQPSLDWDAPTELNQILSGYHSNDYAHEFAHNYIGSQYFENSGCSHCRGSFGSPLGERRARLKDRIGSMFKFGRGRKSDYDSFEDCGCETCVTSDYGCHEDGFDLPNFSSVLGHREAWPTQRGSLSSSTQSYSFEDDEDFPPIREILAQSIFFSELEFMFLQPSFTNNSAFFTSDGVNTIATPFNFDLLPAFRVAGGFESDYGPGFVGEYFQFDNDSDLIDFVSDGVIVGQTEVNFLGGTGIVANLVADELGEQLTTLHSLELHSTALSAFKAIVFKRAYVKGRFGIQIVSIEQVLESELFDPGGASVGTLTQLANFDGFGPRFGIDYVRRIGHTPAQLIASATGALFFGDQDQIIENTITNQFVSLQADEFITNVDIFLGVQGKRIRGEKRNTTFRVGFVNQSWLGAWNGTKSWR